MCWCADSSQGDTKTRLEKLWTTSSKWETWLWDSRDSCNDVVTSVSSTRCWYCCGIVGCLEPSLSFCVPVWFGAIRWHRPIIALWLHLLDSSGSSCQETRKVAKIIKTGLRVCTMYRHQIACLPSREKIPPHPENNVAFLTVVDTLSGKWRWYLV